MDLRVDARHRQDRSDPLGRPRRRSVLPDGDLQGRVLEDALGHAERPGPDRELRDTSHLPALINSNIAVKNTMQIGSATTLHYVDWAVTTSSTPPSPFPAGQRFDCAQNSPFCPIGGNERGRGARDRRHVLPPHGVSLRRPGARSGAGPDHVERVLRGERVGAESVALHLRRFGAQQSGPVLRHDLHLDERVDLLPLRRRDGPGGRHVPGRHVLHEQQQLEQHLGRHAGRIVDRHRTRELQRGDGVFLELLHQGAGLGRRRRHRLRRERPAPAEPDLVDLGSDDERHGPAHHVHGDPAQFHADQLLVGLRRHGRRQRRRLGRRQRRGLGRRIGRRRAAAGDATRSRSATPWPRRATP